MRKNEIKNEKNKKKQFEKKYWKKVRAQKGSTLPTFCTTTIV
jgi:hypothetical protein